jgi:hypothetical protein
MYNAKYYSFAEEPSKRQARNQVGKGQTSPAPM